MGTRATTRTEQVYERIRVDILAGRLHPGDKLPFAVLCSRYSASMGVLREGLTRLVEQGLVVAEPQHGFRVTPLSLSDLEDLTATRCAIEGLALRTAIDNGDLAWESELVAAHHALDRTPMLSADDQVFNEDWTAAHARFHNALLAGCPQQRLRQIATSLRDSAELYRRWSKLLGPDDDRDIPGEHRMLLQATLERRADNAVELLTRHLRHTSDLLVAAEQRRQIEAADAELNARTEVQP